MTFYKIRTMTRYLRTYPIEWPFISIKKYRQDNDGWWNPMPKQRRKKKLIPQITGNDIPGLAKSSS